MKLVRELHCESADDIKHLNNTSHVDSVAYLISSRLARHKQQLSQPATIHLCTWPDPMTINLRPNLERQIRGYTKIALMDNASVTVPHSHHITSHHNNQNRSYESPYNI